MGIMHDHMTMYGYNAYRTDPPPPAPSLSLSLSLPRTSVGRMEVCAKRMKLCEPRQDAGKDEGPMQARVRGCNGMDPEGLKRDAGQGKGLN